MRHIHETRLGHLHMQLATSSGLRVICNPYIDWLSGSGGRAKRLTSYTSHIVKSINVDYLTRKTQFCDLQMQLAVSSGR